MLRYADLTQNDGKYLGHIRSEPDPEGVQRYFAEALGATVAPLDFVVYVPAGYGNVGGSDVPGVEETDDSDKLFTAVFDGGKETWRAAM